MVDRVWLVGVLYRPPAGFHDKRAKSLQNNSVWMKEVFPYLYPHIGDRSIEMHWTLYHPKTFDEWVMRWPKMYS